MHLVDAEVGCEGVVSRAVRHQQLTNMYDCSCFSIQLSDHVSICILAGPQCHDVYCNQTKHAGGLFAEAPWNH
jgi:hypothetical protein